MRSFAQFLITFSAVGTGRNGFVGAQSEDLGPATFAVNTVNPGGGGTTFKDSERFRIYNATSDASAGTALKLLEAAYECWVGVMGWRSSGLSYNINGANARQYLKMNAYAISNPQSIGGAAGVMGSDARSGHAFVKVVANSITNPGVIVHEYGHAMTYYERTWVEQGRTGTWWEPVAEYFADTYMTSPWCAPARQKYGFKEGPTKMDLNRIVGSAHQILVDGSKVTGNYYQSWPFLAYLTYNPDNINGLGKTAVRDMFRKYKLRSNETPFHVLQRVIEPTPLGEVIAKYWARMAVGEIGHPQNRQRFIAAKGRINFANLERADGAGLYKVKESRAPKYMGANIIPLKGAGKASVKVTAQSPFTAMISVRSKSGVVKLTALKGGIGEEHIDSGDEAALIVANTPLSPITYNGFEIGPNSEVSKGLNYEVQILGVSI